MTARQQLWLKALCLTQYFLLIGLLALIFVPVPRGDKFFGPQLCLKEIHALVLTARKSGKNISKDDVQKKVIELQQTAYFSYFKPEIFGSDSNWMLVWAPLRKDQTKFQYLLGPNDNDWPTVIMSSTDDGFVEINKYGRITHQNFDW